MEPDRGLLIMSILHQSSDIGAEPFFYRREKEHKIEIEPEEKKLEALQARKIYDLISSGALFCHCSYWPSFSLIALIDGIRKYSPLDHG